MMKENTYTSVASLPEASESKPYLKSNHFLLDESIDEEIRSKLINRMKSSQSLSKTIQEEVGAKVYDEYAEDKILFSEDQVFSFKPIFEPVLPSSNNYSFISLQKWEGVVTDVNEDSFFARLTDLTQGGSEEVIEFYLDDVPSDDKSLIGIGAIFYWNIGYETIRGQDRKVSLIKFRRLPKWSKKKMQNMQKKGKELMSKIQWQ